MLNLLGLLVSDVTLDLTNEQMIETESEYFS